MSLISDAHVVLLQVIYNWHYHYQKHAICIQLTGLSSCVQLLISCLVNYVQPLINCPCQLQYVQIQTINCSCYSCVKQASKQFPCQLCVASIQLSLLAMCSLYSTATGCQLCGCNSHQLSMQISCNFYFPQNSHVSHIFFFSSFSFCVQAHRKQLCIRLAIEESLTSAERGALTGLVLATNYSSCELVHATNYRHTNLTICQSPNLMLHSFTCQVSFCCT